MIRLPKLFKRKTQSDDLDRDSLVSRRTARKSIPRHMQRVTESEDLALTEDPERQRARHRLIGATVLVFIAVIGLPRILDSKPKAVNNDIAVNIVTSLPAPNAIPAVSETKSAPPVIAVEKSKTPDVPVEAPKDPSPAAEVKPDLKQAQGAVSASSNASTTSGTSKNLALGLAAGEEVVATSPKPKAETKATTGSGKYVIQIGAFASEDRAKGWTAKMKEQKIPNYTNSKTGPDGGKLFLLRAGPFASKETAEAAEKKLKAMGLTPHLVEVGAN